MFSRVVELDRSAIEFLLACLEARRPIISAAALQRFSIETASLKTACLIEPRGHEPSISALTDYSDCPVSLTWSPEQGGYGYFSESDGWIGVAEEDVQVFAVNVAAVITALSSKFDISPRKPAVPVVNDNLWHIGSARLGRRPKRTQVLFGRRLHDCGTWHAVETALRKNPSDRRVLLTSTKSELLPNSHGGCVLISLGDVLGSQCGLEVDPSVVSLLLDQRPMVESDEPIKILAGGREVRFLGETFQFPKGLVQRRVIDYLYGRYLQGELWTSSAKIVDELDLGLKTRIRDLFKRHPAWNRLLTERSGMCGFCFPEQDATPEGR